MTPERAAYHYLMLSMGLRDAFDRDFSDALDWEESFFHRIRGSLQL